MASGVVVGWAGSSEITAEPLPRRNASLIRWTAFARSTSAPSRGGVATGSRPLNVTRPSCGGLSTVSARASTVLASWEASTVTRGSISVVPVSARHTSKGVGKPLGASPIVVTTSSWRPASSGWMVSLPAPMSTTTGLLSLAASSVRSFSAAWVTVRPPMSTPPTRVPRRTEPDMSTAGTR